MRPVWKLPYIESSFLKKNNLEWDTFKTKTRDSVITYPYINKKLLVYNGKWYKKIKINKNHIGFKLGELAVTINTKGDTANSPSLNPIWFLLILIFLYHFPLYTNNFLFI